MLINFPIILSGNSQYFHPLFFSFCPIILNLFPIIFSSNHFLHSSSVFKICLPKRTSQNFKKISSAITINLNSTQYSTIIPISIQLFQHYASYGKPLLFQKLCWHNRLTPKNSHQHQQTAVWVLAHLDLTKRYQTMKSL